MYSPRGACSKIESFSNYEISLNRPSYKADVIWHNCLVHRQPTFMSRLLTVPIQNTLFLYVGYVFIYPCV